MYPLQNMNECMINKPSQLKQHDSNKTASDKSGAVHIDTLIGTQRIAEQNAIRPCKLNCVTAHESRILYWR